MKLGQIEGVVRTEAGFFKGREVTLVEYVPELLALEDLARRAKQAGVADAVHLDPGSPGPLARITAGQPLDESYRTAPACDQKKQIQGTPFSRLQLSAGQATKVNAFVRQDPGKALEWLTPIQREQIKGAKSASHFGGSGAGSPQEPASPSRTTAGDLSRPLAKPERHKPRLSAGQSRIKRQRNPDR